jgi:hypothetical protein
MRRLSLSIVLVCLVAPTPVATGETTQITAGGSWLNAYGTSQDDSLTVLRRTGDGGYVFGGGVGSLSGDALDLDADGLLFKVNSGGSVVWAKRYDAYTTDIVPTSDGGYIAIGVTDLDVFGGTLWLAKLGAGGAIQWQKSYGTFTAEPAAMVVPLADGGYMVSGIDVDVVALEVSLRIMRLDSQGEIVWQKSISGPDEDLYIGYPVPQIDGSHVFVGQLLRDVGDFDDLEQNGDPWILKLSTSGDVEWQLLLDTPEEYPDQIFGALTTTDGGYLLQGTTSTYNTGGAGPTDHWLVKTDAGGTVQWQRAYGGSGNETTFTLPTSDGFLTSGQTTSFTPQRTDVVVAKLDPAGDLEWAKTYAGSKDDGALALPDSSGGYLLFGFTESFDAVGSDGWAAKLDADGDPLWQRAYGGPGEDDLFIAARVADLDLPWLPSATPRGLRLAPAIGLAADELFIEGDTDSYGAGGLDVFAGQLNADGTIGANCNFVRETAAAVRSPLYNVKTTNATPMAASAIIQDSAHSAQPVSVTVSTTSLTATTLCDATPPVEGETTYVAGVAHARGAQNSVWRTDIAIVNIGDGAATVDLTYVPYQSGTPISRTVQLAAGEIREWQDILVSLFDLAATVSSKGTVQITTTGSILSTARTFNQGAAGTFGQYLPARDDADVIEFGSVGYIPLVKSNADFRSNVGFLNVGTRECDVEVELRGGGGGQLGNTLAYTVAAGEYWQKDDIFAAVGSQNAAYAVLETTSATCEFWAFGSVVDNGTNDPTTVPVTTTAPFQRFAIAGIAHASGLQNSVWRSNIAVINPVNQATQLTLTYVPYGAGTPIERTVTLQALATVEWEDILVSLFNVAPSASAKGTVFLAANRPIFASARTYNQGSEGTFGQYLPAIPENEGLRPGDIGIIPHLKANADFRTNIGLLNFGANPATFRVRLFDADGRQVGTTLNRTVEGEDYWQRDDVFNRQGAGVQNIAYATVEITSETGFGWAFASVVDNGTNDPTTIPVLLP